MVIIVTATALTKALIATVAFRPSALFLPSQFVPNAPLWAFFNKHWSESDTLSYDGTKYPFDHSTYPRFRHYRRFALTLWKQIRSTGSRDVSK